MENEDKQENEVIVPTIEDRAKAQGWRPKEEWEGEPDKWVSAETFVAKGELIEKIESLGKKLKDSEKAVKLLTEHNKKVKEAEFKRAVEYLKAQKKQAYSDGDIDKIVEIDEKLAEVKQKASEQKEEEITSSSESTPQMHPTFKQWVSDNSWYSNDEEMKTDADIFGNAYAANNPDKTPEQVLEYVTKRIKRMYPEKFQNLKRKEASNVELDGTRKTVQKDSFDLTDEERRAMNTFVNQGILTKEQYIEQIKTIRG